MVVHCELDLFYDTPKVCGYSKCKGMKENPQCVTPSHYINGRIPKYDSLIPPIAVKNLISDIEKACRNTSIVSFVEKL